MDSTTHHGLLFDLRKLLWLDSGLPARVKEQHDQVYTAGVLRKLDFSFCTMLIGGMAVSELGRPGGGLSMLEVYRAAGITVMLISSWLQAYAIMRHTQWYDRHRHVLVALLLLARTCVQAPASIRYLHWRAVHDPTQRPIKLLIEVSSFPAAFFHIGHVMANFRTNLVASSAVLLAFLAYGQPIFVELLRWAPHHNTALALHAWLQSAVDTVLTLLSNMLAPPIYLPQRQAQHPCQLLRLSLWLQLCGQWLFALWAMRLLEAASWSEFLRQKWLLMLAELPPLDSMPDDSAEGLTSGVYRSTSGSTHRSNSSTAGGASGSHSVGTGSQNAHGHLQGSQDSFMGTPAGLNSPSRTRDHGNAMLNGQPPGHSASSRDKMQQQWQQIEQALAQQYPEATAEELQRLLEQMVAAVIAQSQKTWLERLKAVGHHVLVLVLVIALLWCVSGVAASAVHAVANKPAWSKAAWASAMCDGTVLQAPPPPPAWY